MFEALGLARTPEPDPGGLAQLYGRWCTKISFDNAQKRLFFTRGGEGPLPGSRVEGFFEGWLRHGTGGTCWAGSEALASLLAAAGFSAKRAIGTMLANPDTRGPNHGSVVVELEGRDVLVDTSILHQVPLPLDGGRTAGALGVIDARREDERFHVSWRPLHRLEGLRCRIDAIDADALTFATLHETTRRWSPFNFAFTARINRVDRTLGWATGQRVEIDARGEATVTPLDDDGRRALLIDELGFSEEIVDALPEDAPVPPPPVPV